MLCPDANPGRRGGKPATNRLSYGTATHHRCERRRWRLCLSYSLFLISLFCRLKDFLSSFTFHHLVLFRRDLLYAKIHLIFLYYCYYFLVYVFLLILSLPFILLFLASCSSTASPAAVTWPAHLCVERLPADHLDPAVRRVDTARCSGTLLQTNCPVLSATRTRLGYVTPGCWVSVWQCTTSKRQVANWLLLNCTWFANRNTTRRTRGSHAAFIT
jgi:hypothetical protein